MRAASLGKGVDLEESGRRSTALVGVPDHTHCTFRFDELFDSLRPSGATGAPYVLSDDEDEPVPKRYKVDFNGYCFY